MFLLVPAYPASPGQKVVKRLCMCVCVMIPVLLAKIQSVTKCIFLLNHLEVYAINFAFVNIASES